MRRPPQPPHPLPRIADIQALHQSSVGHDLYTFPLVVRRADPIQEVCCPSFFPADAKLAMWFDERGKILIALTHSMTHGTRPAEKCTARCDAASPLRYLYAGIKYHAAVAERAAAELAAEGGDGGKKGRKRNRKNRKHKNKAAESKAGDDAHSPIAEDDHNCPDVGVPPTSPSHDGDDVCNIGDNHDSSDHVSEHESTSAKGNTPADSTQTCFCQTCLNPPARLARLDDSDLEDWDDKDE